MTYREIVNLVLDELKLVSDDSYFVEEHVVFLADKYRMFLLKQRYSDIRREIPESNYQTLCLDLEKVDVPVGANTCNTTAYLRSTSTIPSLATIGKQSVTTVDFFSKDINFVSSERFKYAGSSRGLDKLPYATIAPDHRLYLKSGDSNFYYLRKAKITGIFEDSASTSVLNCADDNTCDILDMRFPLEEALVSTLIELIIKELSAVKYMAADTINNANDDLATIAQYIRQQIADGRRSDLYKNP